MSPGNQTCSVLLDTLNWLPSVGLLSFDWQEVGEDLLMNSVQAVKATKMIKVTMQIMCL